MSKSPICPDGATSPRMSQPPKDSTGEIPTFEMEAIGKRLLTQDNRITQDPIFLVQEKKCEYGVAPGYTDLFTWIHDDDGDPVSPQKKRALEKKYQDDSDDEPKGYRRVGYTERWEYVQACLTEAAAQLYIDENRHNLHEPRIYAASGYRNKEWIAVRAYLKSLVPTSEYIAKLETALINIRNVTNPDGPDRASAQYMADSAHKISKAALEQVR